ncbi:MAG: GNAT family N-acetyltransferase [Scytonema sp. PMC 1069.18]|nr:GNAT family N-acetyltransferase [Scytonema sp. PMC 1069.18]MEC4881989.1 GNAT family N-acetyltransferase [Scytonema sp. PMC 1070.18]
MTFQELSGTSTTIETSRLLLRPLTETDLDDLAEIYSIPEVMRYRLFSQPASFKQTQEFLISYLLHWEQHGFGRWATIYKASQQLIGHCGLEYLAALDEVEVNYLLSSQYWGQGLATESAIALVSYGFKTLQFERLVALAKPENLASLRVMEKIGMQYYKNIQLYDVEWAFYVIKRDQWLNFNRYVP